MDVKDFVATTIEQIVTGVVRAQRRVGDYGAQVNPSVGSGTSGKFHSASGTHIHEVEFDIGVTVTQGESSGAGLSVGIPWIGGGVKGASDQKHEAVNRIRFTIPLALPSQLMTTRAEAGED